MMRSLFAGVSALRNHQLQLDVIGHNIANVNTVGYKASTVTFHELLSQTVRDATAPLGTRGGTNPLQVGLGSQLASIRVMHTQGQVQSTERETDLAVEGEGYFILANGNERFYTRAGMFDIDRDGNLVSVGGLKVMGWVAGADGRIDTRMPLTEIVIPQTATSDPRATTQITFAGNLDARDGGLVYTPITQEPFETPDGTKVSFYYRVEPGDGFNEWKWSIVPVVDGEEKEPIAGGTLRLDASGTIVYQSSQDAVEYPVGDTTFTILPPQEGEAHGGAFRLTIKDPAEEVILDTVAAAGAPPAVQVAPIRVYDSLGTAREVAIHFHRSSTSEWRWVAYDEDGVERGSGTITFSPGGLFLAQSGSITIPGRNGANEMTITPDFSALTQFSEEPTVVAAGQDGYPAGTLRGISIDARGVISGLFSNGTTKALAQVALAAFANPAGLKKAGESLYEVSSNSGEALIGVAGTGRYGVITPRALEMSNVDLAHEFTTMILTQRGFQANSRIITTSDEMLQELVNLKR